MPPAGGVVEAGGLFGDVVVGVPESTTFVVPSDALEAVLMVPK